MNPEQPSPPPLARLYRRLGTPGVCFLAAVVYSFAQVLLTLGMVFYARDAVALSPATVGQVLAVFMLAAVVANLATSMSALQLEPRRLVVLTAFTVGSATGALALTRQPAGLFLGIALCGLGTGFFWPTLSAWLSRGRAGPALGRAVSLYNVSWALGGVIGPLACGWLAERSVRLPLPAGAGLFLLTALFLAGARRRLPVSDPAPLGAGLPHPEDKHAPGDTPLRFAGWLGGFSSFAAMGVLGYIFPMAARECLGLTESTVGWMLLLRTFCNMGAFMVLSRTVFWQFRLAPMVAGQALGAVACFALMAARSPAAIGLLFFVFGVNTALAYANSQFLGVSGPGVNHARRMAIHEACVSGGMMLGSVAGGWLYQGYGMARLYGLCGALLVVSAAAQAAWGARAGRPAR